MKSERMQETEGRGMIVERRKKRKWKKEGRKGWEIMRQRKEKDGKTSDKLPKNEGPLIKMDKTKKNKKN